jgi:hypothetical protein
MSFPYFIFYNIINFVCFRLDEMKSIVKLESLVDTK